MQKLIDMIDTYLDDKIANQISISQEKILYREQVLNEQAATFDKRVLALEEKALQWPSVPPSASLDEDLRLTVVQLVQTVQNLRDEYEENEQLDQYDVESLINDNTLDDDDIDRKIEEAIDSALESLTISVER